MQTFDTDEETDIYSWGGRGSKGKKRQRHQKKKKNGKRREGCRPPWHMTVNIFFWKKLLNLFFKSLLRGKKKSKLNYLFLQNDVYFHLYTCWASHFLDGPMGKESACKLGDTANSDSFLGLRRYLVIGIGKSLQYSSLEYPMDRGAWWATVHGVVRSWTV